MGVETEVKYAADKATLARIQADHPGGETLKMATTYYDTPDGALSKMRCTLRKRQENATDICTVKTPLPGNCRGEWEVPHSDIMQAIPRLCELGAPEILLTATQKGVIPVCGARFTRQAVPIEKSAFSAELALDSGVLTGGGKEAPLCEVELEYKSGDMEAFLAYAADFANNYGLCPEPLSKFRRALNLYLGEK